MNTGTLQLDDFSLKQFPFPLPQELEDKNGHLTGWPVLYVLTNARQQTAYIGETTNFKKRMAQHRANPEKDFSETLLIDSPSFNQSATFDYENRLIELFLADETYHVTNKNNGNHILNYYQRPEYRQHFRTLWAKLHRSGIVAHPIEELENSDLYKYSPFKTLTEDQYQAIETICGLVEQNRKTCTFVSGMPGTGKSILAISLLLKLKTETKYGRLKVGLVTPMEQLRKTYKKLAKSVEGLKPGDIIGPSDAVNQRPYDVLLVDEAHRMYDVHGAQMKPAYRNTCDKLGLDDSATQWDWMVASAQNVIFFFDPKQQVRATGMGEENHDRLLARLQADKVKTTELNLVTQMRVYGGDEYLDFVYDILTGAESAQSTARKFDHLFSAIPYDARSPQDEGIPRQPYQFALVDSFSDFCNLQITKECEGGLSRMAAGYAWKWVSKNDNHAYDIEIDGVKKRWNTRAGGNWVNSEHAVDEVGSIHTVQGYDLNYGFIIIGNDIQYDSASDRLVANKASFYDAGAKKTASPEQLDAIVINAYYVLLTRGMRGTFVYACDSDVKRYLQRFIPTIQNARERDGNCWQQL